ncbi:MAG: sensor domain-containing diguanylate cyclase [Gallionella sp.]|nr:sensor domain-containing diguanylate cyclase [Gallionella sp.]
MPTTDIPTENALKSENERLRHQLQTLLDEARLNEKKLHRLDQLERRLIAARSLPELILLIVQDYKYACDTDAVTLVLTDPEYEITRILEDGNRGGAETSGLVLLEKLPFDNDRPCLGVFDEELPGAIFDPWPSGCRSMVLLPLIRQGELIGSLNLGSCEAERFTADSGTDFLERLASIFAICLENVLNHERLKLVGLTDPLTGVNNRRYFESRFHEEISHARRHLQPLACMFLDIDKFKHINDSLGHLAGDEVLRNVARLIKSQLRGNDVLARFGGEEFVVLLPQTARGPACEIAERIRAMLAANPLQPLPGKSLPVTISIGVAMLSADQPDDDPATAKRLINAADAALYQAKESGRNRVVCAEAA